MKKIILASSSISRRAIMDKLPIAYEAISPHIDESALPSESPEQLVERLSQAKAKAVGETNPNTFVIGADQVAVLGNTILGKPMTEENAIEQLTKQSGQTIHFLGGVCLLNTETHKVQCAIDETIVKFRTLSLDDIHHYIKLDRPLQCAGSFKCESLGMLLVESVTCKDHNALMGLSLITLSDMFRREGINLLHMK